MTVVAFHPGEILQEMYLKPLGITAWYLAGAIGQDEEHMQDLVAKRADMTEDVASLLAEWFETTPQYWLNMQFAYDRQQAA